MDVWVGVGFEREPDIHTERVIASCAEVAGFHDSWTGSGDDHPPVLVDHSGGELGGGLVVRVFGRGACRSVHGDLWHVPVLLKDGKRVPHFLEGCVHQLDIAAAGIVANQFECRDDHLANEFLVVLVVRAAGGDIGDQRADPIVDFGVADAV